MKKYHTLFLVIFVALFLALLSWFLPITYMQSELTEGAVTPVGLANLFNYPVLSFYNFIYVFIYLMSVGGLYGLLNKTGAYRLILDRVAKHVKERQVLCLILTVLVIALIVSFTGYTFEAMLILPFVAGIVLLLGYDKITAAMVTVGSVSVGVIGTTFSKMVAGNFNSSLGSVTYTDLIIPKVIVLLLCAGILIFNIILYARKLEKDTKPETGFLLPEKVKEKSVKVWPLVTILILLVVVLILAQIDWSGAFGITFFTDALTTIKGWKVLSKYIVLTVGVLVILYNVLTSLYKRKKLAKKDEKLMSKRRKIVTICFGVVGFLALLKILLEDVFNATNIMSKFFEEIKIASVIDGFTFNKLLGTISAFGDWTYNDYVIAIVIACLIIKFAYRITFADTLCNCGEGFKNVLYACLVAIIAYTVLFITANHPIMLTVLKPLLQLTDGLNILIYPLCTFVSALFNTDFTYFEYGILNFSYATTYFTSTSVLPLVEFITQTMYGLAVLIAPTSVTLLFTLSVLDIKYTTWLKKMLFIILEFVLIIFVSYVVIRLWII